MLRYVDVMCLMAKADVSLRERSQADDAKLH